MPTLFPSDLSDLGCSHILAAWVGLGPRAGVSWGWGSRGVCGSQWAPHDTQVPGPVLMGPQTPDPGRPSHSYCKPYSTPKLVDALDLKSCGKSPFFPHRSVGDSRSQLPSWESLCRLRQLPPVKHLSGVKIWLEYQEVRKRSSATKAFGCFQQFASNLQARNTISFTKPLIATETRGWKNAAVLWSFRVTTAWNRCLKTLPILKVSFILRNPYA